jgi:hypothetical protein
LLIAIASLVADWPSVHRRDRCVCAPAHGVIAESAARRRKTRLYAGAQTHRRLDVIVHVVAKCFPPTRSHLMKTHAVLFAGTLFLAATAAVAQAPNDAQIASIVVTANQVDIDAGHLAEAKAGSKDVKAFGQQMVTDHSGVNKQAVALVTKLKVKPEDNPTSQSLKSAGTDNIASL